MRSFILICALGCLAWSSASTEARSAPAQADRLAPSKISPLFDGEKILAAIERYMGAQRYGSLIYEDFLVDQIAEAISVRDTLTPYLTPDGNLLLSGSRNRDFASKAAILFDPEFNVIGVGVMKGACQDRCTEPANVILLSNDGRFFEDDFRRWANVNTAAPPGYDIRQASLQSYPIKR